MIISFDHELFVSEDFSKAIELDPANAEAYFNLTPEPSSSILCPCHDLG
jgi:hypothetical protein